MPPKRRQDAGGLLVLRHGSTQRVENVLRPKEVVVVLACPQLFGAAQHLAGMHSPRPDERTGALEPDIACRVVLAVLLKPSGVVITRYGDDARFGPAAGDDALPEEDRVGRVDGPRVFGAQ
jgi:hypothetical protein